MKNLFNILAASLVTCLVLASCGKVETPNNGTPGQKKEPRVISLAFASTRTVLDGSLQPVFQKGDAIEVSDGTGHVTCPVQYDTEKGYYYIETSLEGPLTAVYPASAYTDSEPYFQVPSIQDGTFANANICKAVQSKVEGKLVFENQTAILRFYVDKSIGVKQLTISWEGVSTEETTITVTPLSPNTTLYNVDGGQDDRICYVAISAAAEPGTTYSTLTLKSVTTTQTAYADNTVTREIQNVTLKQNEMYNAFIPYYIEVGDQKWGYCNVGAFLPEEPGKYFAWGDTVGQTWTGSQFIEGGFEDIPYYVDDPAPKILPLEKDAANVIWGEDWRIPTVYECSILATLDPTCRSWKTDFHGATGWLVPNSGVLFFPATGFAPGTTYVLSEDSSYGYYYTRNSGSMDIGDGFMQSFAFAFLVWHREAEKKVTAVEHNGLDCGCTIRPIYVGGSSEPDEPDDDGMILIIDNYDDGWGPNSYPSE